MNSFDAKAYWESVRQRFNDHVKPRLEASMIYGELPKFEKSGEGAWKACCPFHEDSNPSLNISAKTLQYHCFGCKEGGDIVRYVSRKFNVKSKEAFAILAEKSGLDRNICIPSKAKPTVRDLSLQDKISEIRKLGIEKELSLEKSRWKALHDELSGLPHRVDMLNASAVRVAQMYALKVRELGRISDFANMVESLIADKSHFEKQSGLSDRQFAFELSGGKTARFHYSCEFEGNELKTILEKTTLEQMGPGKASADILWSATKVFGPNFGSKNIETEKNFSELEQKNHAQILLNDGKNTPSDPVQAVVFYSEKINKESYKAIEMDKNITKILASEVSRAQELMLQLPNEELQRVAKVLEEDQPNKHLKDSKKLTNHKEIDFEKKDLLLKVEATNREFQKNLFADSPQAKGARNYLNSRGFTDKEIKELGFGLATGKEIYKGLKESESNKMDYVRSGLAKFTKNGELSPIFFDRITIPIKSIDGDVVAFSGRKWNSNDTQGPKYINSSESSLFSKREILYGLNGAREEILKAKNVFVVEGFFDALAMHKAGFKNTVSTMGTALTKEHVTLLKNVSPDVTLIFDSDEAGKKALLRSQKMLEKEVRLSVVDGFSEKDPASQIEKQGKESLVMIVQKNRKVTSLPAEGILESL
jgi:DNA primase catalytic core